MSDKGLRRYVALVAITYAEELRKAKDDLAKLKSELDLLKCQDCGNANWNFIQKCYHCHRVTHCLNCDEIGTLCNPCYYALKIEK
jgi:PP-loop superfamily ATP-utilizing enzyme